MAINYTSTQFGILPGQSAPGVPAHILDAFGSGTTAQFGDLSALIDGVYKSYLHKGKLIYDLTNGRRYRLVLVSGSSVSPTWSAVYDDNSRIYTGSTVPDASLGLNDDVYLRIDETSGSEVFTLYKKTTVWGTGIDLLSFLENALNIEVGTTYTGTANEIQVDGSVISLPSTIITPGSLQVTTILKASPGSFEAPSITFTIDSDTGFYRVGANSVGISAGGSSKLVIDSSSFTVTESIFANKTATIASDLIVSTKIKNANGTASLPSYTFTNDSDTGMYWKSADVIAFSTGGTERVSIASDVFTISNKAAVESTASDALRVDGGISVAKYAKAGHTSYSVDSVTYTIDLANGNMFYYQTTGGEPESAITITTSQNTVSSLADYIGGSFIVIIKNLTLSSVTYTFDNINVFENVKNTSVTLAAGASFSYTGVIAGSAETAGGIAANYRFFGIVSKAADNLLT